MSLLWRDRIQIFLAPDRVDLVRSYRGIKPKQTGRHVAVCEQTPGMPAWEAALAQLKQMLADETGAGISVIISNHFVRYAVIPPQSKIETPAELYAYAAFQMREVYGERATAWSLGVGSWDPVTGAVCAAIEHSLVERLQELAAQRAMRLKGIEPYLTGAFDHWHKRFDKCRAWFALIETGRLCLASLEGGAWRRISNQRIWHHVEDELLATLEREALLFSARGEAEEPVYLFAPEHPEFTLPHDCGWRVVPLQDDGRPAPPHYPQYLSAPMSKTA
ncbi:hypothetical protein [Nitrosovibrio sp. Nv4]|uniref:hypothetical protein n=1 Tax=Nitrosovibrio sp. Nv4 TaxID=1945880 RepID=UPI000BD592B3|nr:hypothetical protein [Nitrosovibrio sp. Nv4]SOD40472.1 hypothetical protein SAMN06298226_0742 [Nitrosovibrio sp. Nv4]